MSMLLLLLLVLAQASPGTDLDTRRVGPFTMQPNLARRLIMAKIESAERRRAEEEIARVTGVLQDSCDTEGHCQILLDCC